MIYNEQKTNNTWLHLSIKLRKNSFHWYESTNKIIFHSYTISTCFQNMSYRRKENVAFIKVDFLLYQGNNNKNINKEKEWTEIQIQT